jgi:hypothetical protein
LYDPLAGLAGKPGPMRDNHPVLGRDHVEPLGSLFTDHLHRLAAAGAVRLGRRGRLVNARQMGGQRAAIDPPFSATHRRPATSPRSFASCCARPRASKKSERLAKLHPDQLNLALEDIEHHRADDR